MSSHLFSRILFVGLLSRGSSCCGRLDGLRALGLEVDGLDTTNWLPSGPRLLRSLVQRTYVHPSVHRMNLQFLASLRNTRYDMVWIEKGTWICRFIPSLCRVEAPASEYKRFFILLLRNVVCASAKSIWLPGILSSQFILT